MVLDETRTMTAQVQHPPRIITESPSTAADVPIPRISLRKRKADSDGGVPICLTSVNSAFLDGLFADVAEIRDPSTPCPKKVTSLKDSPSKKSRASMSYPENRGDKSFKTLGEFIFPSCHNLSPTHVNQTLNASNSNLTQQIALANRSKSYKTSQAKTTLDCLGTTTSSESSHRLLPAVSLSSCNTLTRTKSDLQSSLTENEDKDTYGWFIEMDDQEKNERDPYRESVHSSYLAYTTQTAPEAANFDAEVEWAKAADTVDSVLGDFF